MNEDSEKLEETIKENQDRKNNYHDTDYASQSEADGNMKIGEKDEESAIENTTEDHDFLEDMHLEDEAESLSAMLK